MSDIHHHEQQGRFDTTVDGHLCVLDYQLRDGDMIIQHTGVPSTVGGRGVAARLTQAALDTARERRWHVVARCSYAAAYMRRHPQYRDLLR